MSYYAHSPKSGIPAQTYESHIAGVRRRACEYANRLHMYAKLDGDLLLQSVEIAAIFHDLGKLDSENQAILSGRKKSRTLPYNHVDAGAAYLLEEKHQAIIAAAAIQAHHVGFPDFPSEKNKGNNIFRDVDTSSKTDALLPELERVHKKLVGGFQVRDEKRIKGDRSIFFRMLLSCLADADHTDTAVHYRNYLAEFESIPLRPIERLARLDQYVADLQLSGEENERNALRRCMYDACKNAAPDESIVSCDSPVGSGKTTAIMAHMLAQAARRGLRRIFIVLPYTNIIEQSVEIYRKALTLPGEKAEEVVAELHHRADFENEDIRHLTALWKAPIVVTTAVAFFETLASNSTSTLRRLHELPGSAVFVDESHAALPVKLLPLAWRWMNIYADEWSCYWVLASGTLNRFWDIREISDAGGKRRQVPEIVQAELRNRLSKYEKNRIAYMSDLRPKNEKEFAEWVSTFKGPRLVIVNTVQSAAVLANQFALCFGRERVEHLSTALTSLDRESTLKRIRDRLRSKDDTDWTLIATSCVEAGVDLSFRTGFRELGSLISLMQASGRVNREGNEHLSEMWTFCLAHGNMLRDNPGMKESAEVLRNYIENDIEISPALSKKSLEDEIRLKGVNEAYRSLTKDEKLQCFRSVEDKFKVIASDTRTVVVGKDMTTRIRNGTVGWREIQKNSVQISKYKLIEFKVPMIFEDLYEWNLEYDNFLGYMAGIIRLKKFEGEALIV